MLIPRNATPVYSWAPNCRAKPARTGAAKTRTSTPKNPPSAEDRVAYPIARPASPLRAIRYPSNPVAMAEGVPGMLTRMAEMEPA